MRQGALKRSVSGFLTMLMTAVCFFTMPVSQLNSVAADQQQIGNKDGYDYELWNQWGQGSAEMQVGSDGAFSCSWSGIENCLFRTGKKLEKTKKYGEYNGIYIDYDVEYEPKGNSYMCVYGWTENPTVEYYIVEAWGSWRPPGSTNSLGTVEANGNKYDIYKSVRENQPSIHGTETFEQYWSVRQDNPAQNNVKKEITGRISVSKHFEAWEKVGLDMSGTMYEVALNIEGYQSNGSANVIKNGLVIGNGDGDGGIVKPPVIVEPDENGYFFHSDFEDDTDSWAARGDASIKTDSSKTYDGNNSLYVTGRTDSWNGAARSLNSSVFVPGNSYSFSVMAMQNSTASEDFKLTLQYTKDGEENYDTIATATGAKGEWVQLANTSYTIPSGATNLLIYVETDDSTTNFYMDEAIGAEDGIVIGSDRKYKIGDVNHDGKIDSADILELQNYILGMKASVDLETSDMNGDGIIDSFDLALLRKAVNSKSSETITPPVGPSGNNGVDISWIDPSKPMVAISFDDGAVGTSSNSSSMRILNALSDSGFHSTFFYVGNWTNSSNQDEVKKAYDMGMEIANHTNSHPYLTNLSESEIRSEYDTCAQKLKSIIGAEPSKLLRLPYLASNSTVQSALYDAPLITCSIDTQDWNGASSDQIIGTIKNAMSNGSLDNAIVLCHETYDSTAEAMEYLCPYLKSQGWQIVTISELFAVNEKEMNGGQLYTKCN
ncbi:MAG: glycoside hydrolase family 11 protein [Ruminococcus flavefaciens]|nr:glycoside hydrolase family 11 protein [Ruminococcus flavefaciens]MCM1362817.1 glycoside hydrolase family 11 protein [Clostridiales bacterium]